MRSRIELFVPVVMTDLTTRSSGQVPEELRPTPPVASLYQSVIGGGFTTLSTLESTWSAPWTQEWAA